MAIKDILLHLTDDGEAPMNAAIALAQAHDAHLTGLYPLTIPNLPGFVEVQIGRAVLEQQQELHLQRARAAESRFETAAQAAGIAYESRCVEGDAAELLGLHARYCDLLIMGRLNSDFTGVSTALAESLILESGKPIMLLPKTEVREPPGRHILVAWNATREAVRAIDAALPLLRAAQQVDVVAVNPDSAVEPSLPSTDISAHLARHGVNVRAEGLTNNGENVGQTLLARAHTDGADLLVMGAYGHARWRERILGGATAHVLASSDMPVVLAH